MGDVPKKEMSFKEMRFGDFTDVLLHAELYYTGVGASTTHFDDAVEHPSDVFDMVNDQDLMIMNLDLFKELYEHGSMIGILVAKDLVQNQKASIETCTLTAEN